jgi:Transposase
LAGLLESQQGDGLRTVGAWWPELETFPPHPHDDAKAEAANLTIKNTQQTGRGFTNPAHYRCRIVLTSAAYTTA